MVSIEIESLHGIIREQEKTIIKYENKIKEICKIIIRYKGADDGSELQRAIKDLEGLI